MVLIRRRQEDQRRDMMRKQRLEQRACNMKKGLASKEASGSWKGEEADSPAEPPARTSPACGNLDFQPSETDFELPTYGTVRP